MAVDAVIFDLDGVLLDSEPIWSEVRQAFTLAHGGQWAAGAQERMMGMSTREWAQFLHDDLHVAQPVGEIVEGVVGEMQARYGRALPWLPGAIDAVARLASRWPLGLASSSPSQIIALVLERPELGGLFQVAVSTEEIGVGKPAPDVYLAVAHRLGVAPERCAAVEDSTNGLRSAGAAGMRVVAVPRSSYPPDAAELAHADVVLDTLADLTEDVVDRLGEVGRR